MAPLMAFLHVFSVLSRVATKKDGLSQLLRALGHYEHQNAPHYLSHERTRGKAREKSWDAGEEVEGVAEQHRLQRRDGFHLDVQGEKEQKNTSAQVYLGGTWQR